jgi:hypothetical protein
VVGPSGAVVGPGEAAAWAAEQGELGARGELFFAFTQCCFTAVGG